MTNAKKRVVIVGAGFAGLSAAKAFKGVDVQVTLIDRRNYHLFQPLLYQVATAALSPAQIAQPIRGILRKYPNCSVNLADVTGVDKARRVVITSDGDVPYDYLVIATGSTHTYFGKDSWSRFAPGLKSIEDATSIRQRILSAFERAEASDNPAEQKSFMTFIVVGGGPTGVEMAGAISELARHTLKDDFRKIDPLQTRVILAEAGNRVLNGFPEKLSHRAEKDLRKLGVEIVTGHPVADCNEDGVTMNDTVIPAKTVIWAAGVKASPAAEWLQAEKDRAGRVIVNTDMSVPGHNDIFVLGDTASLQLPDGRFVPGLAQPAMQQGRYVAKLIAHRISDTSAPGPFIYKHYGMMATIGRGAAIVDFGKFTMDGFITWVMWGVIHLLPLIGFRNRFVVMCDWLWSYFTHERGVRLITVAQSQKD
ncbi:MAG TPA: NAD(P)/FAD-dependent oxidoreductase [Alphaproteobacteria bacterium]